MSVADALRGISSHLAELDEVLAGMPKVIAGNGAPLEPVEGVVALSLVDSAVLDGGYLRFKAGDAVLFSVDASPFIKDGMVDAVEIADGNLVITFNTDSGKQPVSIPLTDIFDADDYYNKAAVDSLLSGKRDRTDLSVDPDKWLLVKPDGTLVWLEKPEPQQDVWTGDGFTLDYNIGIEAHWSLVKSTGSGWVVDDSVALLPGVNRLEFIGSDGTSVYRLVRGSRLALDTEIPPAQVVDSAVTRTSANPVKSSGIWAAIWGALATLPSGVASLYDWCVAQLAGKRGKADLAVYSYAPWTDGMGQMVWDDSVGRWIGAGSSSMTSGYQLRYANGTWTLTYGIDYNPYSVAAPEDVLSLTFPNMVTYTRMSVYAATSDALAKTSQLAAKQDALSADQLANIAAVSGKADAADLRYALADAVVRKALPADCFPVTFTREGVAYSVNSLVEESEASAAGDMYIMVNGTDYSLTMVESPATGSERMSVIDVASFGTDGVFETSGIDDLQFGGVAPVADASPTLADILVLADRTVNLITATDETSIDIELPAAQEGYSRDFYLAVTCGSTAPTLNAPSGITLVDAKGEQPDLSLTPSATTVLRFTEVKEAGQSTPVVFCVTGGANGGGSIDPSVLEAKRDKTDFASLGGWILTEYVGGGSGAPVWLAFTNPGWAGGGYSLEYTASPESSFSLSQDGTQIGTVEASEDAVALEFESAIGDPINLVRGSRLALDTEIPPMPVAPVAPSTDPSAEGKPADAEATGVALAGKADSTALAPDWDPTKAYLLGEHVSYMGKMYECILSMSAASQTNPSSDTTHWKLTDLAAPDATLDIMSDGRLRVVAADGQVLWTQGYALASESASTLSCERINKYVFAATTATAFSDSSTYAVGDRVTYGGKVYKCSTAVGTAGAWTGATNWDEDPDTQAFALPNAPSGVVGNFVLDVDNTANEVQVMVAISGTLGTDYDLIVEKGRSSVDVLTIEGGALAELYFTMTAFGTAAKPAWRVVRLNVERQGVGS